MYLKYIQKYNLVNYKKKRWAQNVWGIGEPENQQCSLLPLFVIHHTFFCLFLCFFIISLGTLLHYDKKERQVHKVICYKYLDWTEKNNKYIKEKQPF